MARVRVVDDREYALKLLGSLIAVAPSKPGKDAAAVSPSRLRK